MSIFTLDEYETDTGSLSFGEEFNESFWQNFKYKSLLETLLALFSF